MGVLLKWLRRERITLTSHRNVSPSREQQSQSDPNVGTIRTEEYKRDLAEFTARRSSGAHEPADAARRKCRHSLSGCTDCAADADVDADKTFNYEKKSASKYKKKKRARSVSVDHAIPKIHFLFPPIYSEPYRPRPQRRKSDRSDEFTAQKHIDFKDDEDEPDAPLFFKNNSLPYDVRNFLDGSPSDEEGFEGERRVSSRSFSSSARDDSSGDKLLEVMTELRNLDHWADEQLKSQSTNSSKCDDGKSDVSAYGLPVVSSSDVDVTVDKHRQWSGGRWGAVPVQVRRLPGVNLEMVRRGHTEVNVLRKCRHPNIILLMGLYPDIHRDVHLICERCVDTLYNIIHVQGRVLSAQTSVSYANDVTSALLFLRMRGYILVALRSHGVVVTSRDTAKLADLSGCAAVKEDSRPRRGNNGLDYESFGQARGVLSPDCEPLLSSGSVTSVTSLASSDVTALASSYYRWLPPELFAEGKPCARGEVYGVALMIWECCNSTVPWKTLTYEQLKARYTISRMGIRLPADGSYPGALLALLQDGLRVARGERPGLRQFADRLAKLKDNLDQMEYIVIPARQKKKKSIDTSPLESPESGSPKTHEAIVHCDKETDSDKDNNAIYESLGQPIYATVEKCTTSEDETDRLPSLYEKLRDNDFSSACSTPISKVKTKIRDIGTPLTLHRSDSTEYCSILSPDSKLSFDRNNNATEKSMTKLSRSFTPQSYKPLHIKLPEFNLDSLKELPKENNSDKPSYSFDIKNYTLPKTPIARSTKLRKNAWLSGELAAEKKDEHTETANEKDCKQVQLDPETPPPVSTYSSIEKDNDLSSNRTFEEDRTPDSVETRNQFIFRHSKDTSSSFESRDRNQSWSFKTSEKPTTDEGLAHVNVKPLVAIHEKWIYEANKKSVRSSSLPSDDSFRSQVAAVKPASHAVDPWQNSLSHNPKKTKYFKPPNQLAGKNGLSEQFCAARDTIARCMSLAPEQRPKGCSAGSALSKNQPRDIPPPPPLPVRKVDQTTDTDGIEDFIRDIIRKEILSILHAELNEDKTPKGEDLLTKGISSVMEALKVGDESKTKFSRLKINGNNKPLLQITFSRNGENNLQVLDNCVNVTYRDRSEGRDNTGLSVERDLTNSSIEEPVTPEDCNHSLKRCQTFNAIQEARSTEDLYIDDDISTQMQENFGGRVKLIPLHGSLHEILCEREDDCCLIKVKQENGCDTIYFRCDNSDTESRDAIDGATDQDTVVYKRSISLIEERIERRVKDKRPVKKTETRRPKSEVFVQKFNREMRVLSNSSPSLSTIKDADEVELNIENVMCYQDSSSDECLKCQDDEFELLERAIELEVEKDKLEILEEKLSVIDETSERETGSEEDCKC